MDKPVKSKRMCIYRLQSPSTRRTYSPYTLLPHAQHRNDDVQRTYILQQRRIHHHAKASRPNRIKSNPASKAAIQASVCVSTVIKVKSESNSIQPRRPATRVSLSWCKPRPVCSSSFRLAFQRCWVPAVAFVQQRDHADAGAGAERTTTQCYQSVNNAITTKLCC